jgi:hypothetical protein
MGKHATEGQKITFITHLQYVHCAEAARRAGLTNTVGKDLKAQAGQQQVEAEEAGLPPPTVEELVARKPGSGAKEKITFEQVTDLLDSCTIDKKQRKKLWHIIAKEDGFFDLHKSTIKKKLRARGLRQMKSTKKLGLTDIQKAQRYEIALSRAN